MKGFIKNLFTFHKSEHKGILFLAVIMMGIYSLDKALPSIIPQKKYDDEKLRREITEFIAAMDKMDSLAEAEKAAKYKKYDKAAISRDTLPSPLKMRPFDPNLLSEEEWNDMGIPSRIINTILNYRDKGGVFRKKEDLQKIYGLDGELYASLEPYVIIPDKPKYPDKSIQNDKEKSLDNSDSPLYDTLVIELNGADSSELTKLRGIGPYYALKILRYRERLGGFFSKEQMMEIKGIDTARFSLFQNQILIDTSLITKIDLNRVAFKELLRHPYFEYAQVKAIFDYRYKNHYFRSREELQKVPLIYDSLYQKMSPYIIVIPPD